MIKCPVTVLHRSCIHGGSEHRRPYSTAHSTLPCPAQPSRLDDLDDLDPFRKFRICLLCSAQQLSSSQPQRSGCFALAVLCSLDPFFAPFLCTRPPRIILDNRTGCSTPPCSSYLVFGGAFAASPQLATVHQIISYRQHCK